MATKVEIEGKSGVIMTMQKCRETYLPGLVVEAEEHLQKTADFIYKDGDLIVNTYPKTGTHWIAELLFMVRNANTEHWKMSKAQSFEFTKDFDSLNHQPPPRIFFTHLPFRLLPREHKQKKGKIIILFRNPKDTMVSMFYFLQKEISTKYTGTWDEFFDLFTAGIMLYGNYLDRVKEWEIAFDEFPDHDILTIFYEDLQKDCLKELKRICKYLDLERSDDLLKAIVKQCNMGKVKQALLNDPEEVKNLERLSTDKTPIMYRKGVVGDWKNHFTVAQNEVYDRMLSETLGDSRFKFQYEPEDSRRRLE